MTSVTHRHGKTHKKDTERQEPFVVCLEQIPEGCQWQEVKDIVRLYGAATVKRTDTERDDNGILRAYASIAKKEDAYKAYRSFVNYGWNGRTVVVSLVLALDRGIDGVITRFKTLSPTIVGPSGGCLSYNNVNQRSTNYGFSNTSLMLANTDRHASFVSTRQSPQQLVGCPIVGSSGSYNYTTQPSLVRQNGFNFGPISAVTYNRHGPSNFDPQLTAHNAIVHSRDGVQPSRHEITTSSYKPGNTVNTRAYDSTSLEAGRQRHTSASQAHFKSNGNRNSRTTGGALIVGTSGTNRQHARSRNESSDSEDSEDNARRRRGHRHGGR